MRGRLLEKQGTPDHAANPARESDMAALKLFISHSSRLRDDEANDLLAQRNWQLLQNTRQALDTAIALRAADLHRQYKLATADAIVYATAQQRGAELLTCDAHFDGLPDVAFFGKGKEGEYTKPF